MKKFTFLVLLMFALSSNAQNKLDYSKWNSCSYVSLNAYNMIDLLNASFSQFRSEIESNGYTFSGSDNNGYECYNNNKCGDIVHGLMKSATSFAWIWDNMDSRNPNHPFDLIIEQLKPFFYRTSEKGDIYHVPYKDGNNTTQYIILLTLSNTLYLCKIEKL